MTVSSANQDFLLEYIYTWIFVADRILLNPGADHSTVTTDGQSTEAEMNYWKRLLL